MKANISVNEFSRTITLSCAFSKKAACYGSSEYETLQKAKKDNPGFTVVRCETKRPASRKKLTLDFMEDYIVHNSEGKEANITVFNTMKTKLLAKNHTMTFGEITKWFVQEYEGYKSYSRIDGIIADAKASAEAKADAETKDAAYAA